MDNEKSKLGRWGEKEAVRFLKRRGYRIIGRNVASGIGEIDVIARDGDELVFVEVKTRTRADFGGPLPAVDRSKRRKLIQLARTYLAQHRMEDVDARFDVVGVTAVEGGKKPEIELVQDAFSLNGP